MQQRYEIRNKKVFFVDSKFCEEPEEKKMERNTFYLQYTLRNCTHNGIV